MPAEGRKHSVTPDFTLAHMTQLIMPQHANSLGITFGGQVCFTVLNAQYSVPSMLTLRALLLMAILVLACESGVTAQRISEVQQGICGSKTGHSQCGASAELLLLLNLLISRRPVHVCIGSLHDVQP